MAQNREYAYFLKGNKIAIVERDWRFGSGQTLGVPGINDVGQQGATYWKSPTENSTLGLEIEYSYSPKYSVNSSTPDVDVFPISGYTVVDGYVSFVSGRFTGDQVNWTSAPYNIVTSGSKGDTGGQTLDYILVRGSSKWNGLHKVQTAGTNGLLKTYTKSNERFFYKEGVALDFTNEGLIYDSSSGNHYLGDSFSVGDYLYVMGENAQNQGVYDVNSVTLADGATNAITVGSQYYFTRTDNSDGTDIAWNETKTKVHGFFSDSDDTSADIYKIKYEPNTYILCDVDVLNDEGDEINIPNYLSKALVCYVKAKIAEDQMNMEAKEYYMRMFREKLEKHDTSRVWGKKAMMPSRSAIR